MYVTVATWSCTDLFVYEQLDDTLIYTNMRSNQFFFYIMLAIANMPDIVLIVKHQC